MGTGTQASGRDDLDRIPHGFITLSLQREEARPVQSLDWGEQIGALVVRATCLRHEVIIRRILARV